MLATMHHSYISGLAFHTKSMLAISDSLINEYPLVSKDLVYAGILLHDVAKTLEFTCYEGAEYSKEGKLIGHISLAFREVAGGASHSEGFCVCSF